MDITKDSPINLDVGYQIQDKSACFEDGQSDHIEDAQTQELQAEDFNDPRNWPQWKVPNPQVITMDRSRWLICIRCRKTSTWPFYFSTH